MFVLGWLACDEQTTPTDTGPCTDCCDDTVATGPATLARLTLTCEGDALRWFAETTGWTDAAWVFTADTAGTGWGEEHDLTLSADDACRGWAQLEQTVPAASGTATEPVYERNGLSALSCDGLDGLTVAIALLDSADAVVECVAAGHDPQGLIDGTYDLVMTNEPSFDLSGCAIGALGR